ncbi:winged helix-turn-helix domain-containing protein [Streptomyces olindensis]|uniref:Winged helix-turn-helix domain-containing protein n=1 Tax=Streptomyces olindensis TaxID=358823 RepID=A0ABV2XM25_9ACTN
MDETGERVVRVLRERIFDGTFPPGALLPSQRELAEEFDVSRYTVLQALRRLLDEGVVESRQGSGTRVVRGPWGGGRPVLPGRRLAALGPLVQAAFSSRVVTIDVFSLSGESLALHVRLNTERILTGEIRPESISVRLLLARPGPDFPLFTTVGDPEDHRARDRLERIAAMQTATIRDSLDHLRHGFVPDVRFELAQTSIAPMQKLYLLNTTDVVTGYYEVLQRRMILDSAEEIDVHDILGLGAPLHHHSTADAFPHPESVAVVDSAKRWYEHAWATAEPSGTG